MTRRRGPDPSVPRPHIVRLPDGRALAFRIYGPADGRPVFYFHGTGGNGAAPHLERWGNALGLRFAATDRPGYGWSSFHRRRIVDTAHDITYLADHLGWDVFSCLGVSGGGPYALATAATHPDRLDRAIVVSGVGPPEAPDHGFHPSQQARRDRVLGLPYPWSVPGLLPAQVQQALRARRAERVVASFVDSPALPPADRRAVALPHVQEALAAPLAASRLRDARGLAWEMQLFVRPWGFDLERIEAQVDFWVGLEDVSISPAATRWMADKVPGSRLHEIGDAGHALALHHGPQILAVLSEPSQEALGGTRPSRPTAHDPIYRIAD